MKINLSFYRQQLNLETATFSLIEHEDAIVATVYKVLMQDSTTYILKICLLPRHYERELYFLNYFADKIPVPRVIDHVPPTESTAGALLLEYFSGNVLKKADLTDSSAFEMGTLLAKIHKNRTSGYGDPIHPTLLTDRPGDAFIEKFEKHLAECSKQLPEDLVRKCKRYVHERLYLLQSVDGPCMVHWDFRPGNIMALNGVIQGVIDWSSSRSDFAEEDFCSMEHDGWASEPTIKVAFLSGYATIRPVPDYREIMPLLRLFKALGYMGFTVRTNTWNDRNAAFYQRNKLFVEEMFR